MLELAGSESKKEVVSWFATVSGVGIRAAAGKLEEFRRLLNEVFADDKLTEEQIDVRCKALDRGVWNPPKNAVLQMTRDALLERLSMALFKVPLITAATSIAKKLDDKTFLKLVELRRKPLDWTEKFVTQFKVESQRNPRALNLLDLHIRHTSSAEHLPIFIKAVNGIDQSLFLYLHLEAQSPCWPVLNGMSADNLKKSREVLATLFSLDREKNWAEKLLTTLLQKYYSGKTADDQDAALAIIRPIVTDPRVPADNVVRQALLRKIMEGTRP